MLYIVQVVIWGVAETPQLFLDEARAREAFVAAARAAWEQRYLAYCEHHGIGSGEFASAEAFVATIDPSEKSRVNYWTFNLSESGLGTCGGPAGPGPEEIRKAADEAAAVKEGLARLLDQAAALAARLHGPDIRHEAPAAAAVEQAPTVAAAAPLEESEDPDKYRTDEWKRFAGTVARLCGGMRNEFALLPRDEWRNDVYSSRTSLEYLDWVADRVVRYREKGKAAGYSVVEEPAAPGYYRFADRDGIASEERYDSELEAWCAAGLHSEQSGGAAAA